MKAIPHSIAHALHSTGFLQLQRKHLRIVGFFALIGTFRFDYEYEIEYEYDFRISNQ